MKHTRIVTKVKDGTLNPLVARQVNMLLHSVKDGTSIVLELFQVPRQRTAAQNDGFHAMITPWAKDEGHNVDELKRDLLGEVFGWEESPLGKARVPVRPTTSGLSIEEFNQLMERTVDIAAECGYILQLPSEYQASKWMPEDMRR